MKQPKCPSIDEWIKIVDIYLHTHTHTHNGILAIKRTKLPFAAIWMNSEGIMLSEISQRITDTA